MYENTYISETDKTHTFIIFATEYDHLCGLVVRVPGC
jgi:hypothetical protein